MDRSGLEAWLLEYGRAWERKDTERFVSLFAPAVRYFWTPFEGPKQGRAELAAAFGSAVARQEAIRFTGRVLAVTDVGGLAHWRCSFDRIGTGRRVSLDGVFEMEFDGAGQCRIFREWWHSDE